MNLRTALKTLVGVLAMTTLAAGCGGGGDAAQGEAVTGSVSVLAWSAPATYNDNTSMDPYVDLDCYEIYLRPDGNFTDNDLPVAQVAAVTDAAPSASAPPSKALVTEFNLDLIPAAPAGSRFYVSIRAIGIDGQKSAFMEPVIWDRS